ncbi:uncharacterized protein FOMMEDRAFT_153968 [Fomitiporia mediterranea MF3/22]|uniref:uncharacterized protein n=1 Tax=Fomitiporia mediterranea (strain MF3/22) TaxID=694068 RepID=UPI0004409824|nr:uncharacterized protein FOMMEDRAFT_153968 [Fomitiporia mediterranea MF3/22]EJD04842.1 hypothetical protein FOMMEDRAFT_153968 [Fomitiporia mediterranea MF3/22]
MTTNITHILMYPTIFKDREGTNGNGNTASCGEKGCMKEVLEALESADGWIRAYNGKQVMDDKFGCWVFDWQSTSHREAFLTKEAHAPLLSLLRKPTESSNSELGVNDAGKGKSSCVRSVQVGLDPPHAPLAFGAPVTEIAVSTLRDSINMDAYEALMRRVVDVIGQMEGVQGVGWGKVISDANDNCNDDTGKVQYVLVVGWGSAEARATAATKPDVLELYKESGGFAEYETRVFQLEKHETEAAAFSLHIDLQPIKIPAHQYRSLNCVENDEMSLLLNGLLAFTTVELHRVVLEPRFVPGASFVIDGHASFEYRMKWE